MPVIDCSSYAPPPFFSNPHVQTIYPAVFRKVHGVRYRRERIFTPDDDFLDLDWSELFSRRLAILCHGLEGDSSRSYILGMVKALNIRGWSALAWNYRGCSGEPNRRPRSYHSGATEDLATVIEHAVSTRHHESIALIGFSLGGNLILKYLGDCGEAVCPAIEKAVVFSVPCDLASSARKISSPRNRIYLRRFLRMLHEKIRAKMEVLPGRISDADFDKIKDFKDFDDRYTAPLHGYQDAEDYWRRASSGPVVGNIRIPTLVVNAADDPYLAPACYPRREAQESPRLFLEIPRHGGHVGFVRFGNGGEYWSESRALSFLTNNVDK